MPSDVERTRNRWNALRALAREGERASAMKNLTTAQTARSMTQFACRDGAAWRKWSRYSRHFPFRLRFPPHPSPIARQKGTNLVKYSDAQFLEIERHEIETLAADLHTRGRFIASAGGSGDNSHHAVSARGCAAFQAGISRSSCPERGSAIAGGQETSQ